MTLIRSVVCALAASATLVRSEYPPYDESLAQNALIYSSAAYCPPDKVDTWSDLNTGCAQSTSGFAIHKSYSVSPDDDDITQSNHAFGFVGVDSTRGWVVGAFKGSNQTADFVTDISGGEFIFSSCTINGKDFGRVHKGFCNYYMGISEQGFAADFAALVAANPSYTPVLTGHSLGAAAAVLAARDLYETEGIKTTLYTYGQPRVADYSFSEDFQDMVTASYRVVHSSDWVAHLPVCCAVFGGCKKAQACPYHTTDEIWYNNDMNVTNGDTFEHCDGGEDSSCQNTINMSIEDHLTYFGIPIGSYCCF